MNNAIPIVSVLILYWNNDNVLETCLKSLAQQASDEFEIIIVDNGSSQNQLNAIVAKFRHLDVKIKTLSQNIGFAAGNNLGARLARGEWLALLNADAFPEPGWLKKLLETAENHPEYACFSSRQIQAKSPHLLDGAGDAYHISGLAWRRFYNKPVQNYGTYQQEVFSACPAAALYRRADFLQAGGFDEDYFSYFEDVDLGFRLRLAGKKCLYVPEAVVHHVGSASTGKRSDFSVYYGYRNMIWTFFKDMPSPLLWLFLPIHLAALSFFVVYLASRGQSKVILRAIGDAARGLPAILQKRKIIQKNRRVKSSELLKVMSTGLLEPYWEFLQRNRTK